ncbi:NID [Mytilus coruscus]|uniref:NID n=1 Tax=Mytilus coruscus TaxID=42192 RepID=A0A6J8AWE0_MYTCO|nr:NID [Mytilus coruscus]
MLFLQAHRNNLLRYELNGKFLSESHINTAPSDIGYDLAIVDSNTVAVSSGGNLPHTIYLIDMNSAKTRQDLDIDNFCYGLSYNNGSLVCCTSGEGIKIFDMSHRNSTNLRILPNAPIDASDTYVNSNKKCIFHSNCHDNSVVCYDFSGQVQWTYSDLLLRKPYGITLDSYSNIYVAGFLSNNVVVISPDGKQAKELIGASDGLLNPRAIYFDKTKNLLLVANCNKFAFLFDV